LIQDLFAGTQPYLGFEEPVVPQSEWHAAGSVDESFPAARDPRNRTATVSEPLPIRRIICLRSKADPGRRQFARCAPFAAWAERLRSSRAARDRTSSTSTATYIDYVWLLGTADPGPLFSAGDRRAARSVLEIGTSFGAPTEREVELAELIRECVPSIEMVRLVSSGTEATMSALRVARGFTGRDLTIKFEGCYHGHVDSLLVKAGSGMATLGIADTAGVPEAFAATTIALPFNSIAAVESAFREHPKDRGRDRRAGGRQHGLRASAPGFLEALRESPPGMARC
jgi:hypothetical protein